jgi:hypothetical protein
MLGNPLRTSNLKMTSVVRNPVIDTYLNHAVSEGSINKKISLPGVNGRLSAKQISSSSARRHAICFSLSSKNLR